MARHIPHAAIPVSEAYRMHTTELGQVYVTLAFAHDVVAATLHAPASVERLAVDTLLIACPPPSRDDERRAGLVHEHTVGFIDDREAQAAHHQAVHARLRAIQPFDLEVQGAALL